jgi:hypothetical protein
MRTGFAGYVCAWESNDNEPISAANTALVRNDMDYPRIVAENRGQSLVGGNDTPDRAIRWYPRKGD